MKKRTIEELLEDVGKLRRMHRPMDADKLIPCVWERNVDLAIMGDPEYHRRHSLSMALLDLFTQALSEEQHRLYLEWEEEKSAATAREKELLLAAGYKRGYLDAAEGHCATVKLV
jgi:hypothetical protein